MLRSALAALQSRKREKKSTSSGGAKALTAPSKFKLRLKKKGGAIGVAGGAAAAAPQPLPPSSSSPSATSTFSVPMVLRARLSALAGSASAILLLAAQVASLLLTFYVSVVRLALDLPLSLGLTISRTAAAIFLESRPVAALAAAATEAAGRASRAASTAAAAAEARLLPLVPARLSRPLLSLVAATTKKKKRPSKKLPGCVFYECALHHRRLRPARHDFEYRVRMALVDLDAPPRWFSELQDKKKAHLSAAEAREAAGLLPSSKGPVWLLTMPPAAGYSQNPISVYYCYAEGGAGGAGAGAETFSSSAADADDGLFSMPPARSPVVAAVAEVTNTPWGSVARFSFDPSGDSVPKCLHVSPFMDMRNEWRLTAPAPGARLALSVAALHPELGAFFQASLVGRIDSKARTRACLAERSGDLRTFWDYAYGPQRVALWIYGHAAVLFWRKRLSVFGPPELGAGAKAVEERRSGSGGSSSKKRRGNGSSLSSLSSSSSSRWHEWVAAKEWPWRVGPCGI